jgi:putative Holliday junction resolvase
MLVTMQDDYNSEVQLIEGYHLGVDYGERNLGVAVSDSLASVASPLEVVKIDKAGNYWAKLRDICRNWQVTRIVLGLAKNTEDKDTDSSKAARKWAKQARVELGIEIEFFAEQLSTKMSNQGLPRSKKRSMGDAYAAAHILQGFLDWKRELAARGS